MNRPTDPNLPDVPTAPPEPNLPPEPHDDLAARLRALPATIEPERDLWPAIAARIEAPDPAEELRRIRPSRPRRYRRLALAASLLAALALGWSLHARLRPAPVVVELPAPPRAQPAPSGVEATAYAATGRELDAIRDELRRAIEARRDALPPETRRLVFDSLATIERAIGEIETALAAAPADAELARTYVAYRQRQIDLLRQANRLAARL